MGVEEFDIFHIKEEDIREVVDLEKVSPLLRGKVIEAKINSLFSEKFSNKVLLDYVSKNFLLLIGNRLSLDDVTFGDIRKLEILEKRFFILDTGNKKYIFDILADDNIFVGNEEGDIIKVTTREELDREKQITEIKELIGEFSEILDEIEKIFTRSDGGYLDLSEDISKNEKFKGKNLKQLQLLARNKWYEILKLESRIRENQGDLQLLEKKYLTYIVGLGDKYENGALLFDKTEEELDLLIKREINNVSNVQQVFGVYKNYHIVINNNWNKSKEIEQTNSIFIRKLNRVIFYKLVNLGATDEELLTFANYTIGKGIENQFSMGDMDGCNEILSYLMIKKRGLIDKFSTEGDLRIEDKEVGNQTVGTILDNLKKEFASIEIVGYENSNKDEITQQLFKEFGLDGFLDKTYNELLYEGKKSVSIIARLLKKILTIRPKKLTLQELSNFIMESLKDFNDIVQASFENVLCPPEDLLIITMKVMNSGGYYVPSAAIPFGLFKNKNGEKLFNDTDIKILELYKDVNGVGPFDFKYSTTNILTSMVSVLIPTIIGGILIMSVCPSSIGPVLSGIIGGAGATISNWAVNGQGYNTKGDMFNDLFSDFLVGTSTGAVGGWVTKVAKVAGSPIGTGRWWADKGIFAADFTLLGLAPELGREHLLPGIYGGLDIYNLFDKTETQLLDSVMSEIGEYKVGLTGATINGGDGPRIDYIGFTPYPDPTAKLLYGEHIPIYISKGELKEKIMKLFTKEVEFEYFEELISRINKYKAKVNNGKRVGEFKDLGEEEKLLVDKFVRNDIDINELKNELLKRLFFNLNSDKANLYDIIMRDLDLLIDGEKKVEDILSEVENLSEKRKEEGYST